MCCKFACKCEIKVFSYLNWNVVFTSCQTRERKSLVAAVDFFPETSAKIRGKVKSYSPSVCNDFLPTGWQ